MLTPSGGHGENFELLGASRGPRARRFTLPRHAFRGRNAHIHTANDVVKLRGRDKLIALNEKRLYTARQPQLHDTTFDQERS